MLCEAEQRVRYRTIRSNGLNVSLGLGEDLVDKAGFPCLNCGVNKRNEDLRVTSIKLMLIDLTIIYVPIVS